jgi:hypothetical protein
MRILLLKDKKVKQSLLSGVMNQFIDLYHTNTGIIPTYDIEERDFSIQEGEERYNFDTLPYGLTKREVDAVHKKYREQYDHIIFSVHRDHCSEWGKVKSSTGNMVNIWGENFSNVFYKYDVEVCRFDDKNLANSLGTIYHEVHHSHNTTIKTYLGVNVEQIPALGIKDWDNDITHGGGAFWDYIRHTENQASLVTIALLLKQSYEKRKQLFNQEKITMLQTMVKLLQQLIVLQRSLVNKNITKCHSHI